MLIAAAVEEADAGEDRRADAARARHQGRHHAPSADLGVSVDPHRHPLHRGRHLDPALRAGPRDRPRDRRLPDDGPLAAARGARRAGADHGRRRVPVRVRRRLGRGDDPRRGRRTRVEALVRRARRRRPGRLPRPREPGARRRQLDLRDPGRRDPDRRLDPPVRRRRRQHAERGARRGVRQAGHHAPASTCCACSTSPRRSCGR